MYHGDRSRNRLAEYGFRLPSALDNRPLTFEEFENNGIHHLHQCHRAHELEHSQQIAEQIIRPTGLVDPQVEIRPTRVN